jgi:hypothetical protein
MTEQRLNCCVTAGLLDKEPAQSSVDIVVVSAKGRENLDVIPRSELAAQILVDSGGRTVETKFIHMSIISSCRCSHGHCEKS